MSFFRDGKDATASPLLFGLEWLEVWWTNADKLFQVSTSSGLVFVALNQILCSTGAEKFAARTQKFIENTLSSAPTLQTSQTDFDPLQLPSATLYFLLFVV